MKKLIPAIALVAFVLAGTSPASAQDPTDENIKLFRKDLRSLRKQIIAANMDLSDKEAEEFWPVFERYTQELAAKTGREIRTTEGVCERLLEDDRHRGGKVHTR